MLPKTQKQKLNSLLVLTSHVKSSSAQSQNGNSNCPKWIDETMPSQPLYFRAGVKYLQSECNIQTFIEKGLITKSPVMYCETTTPNYAKVLLSCPNMIGIRRIKNEYAISLCSMYKTINFLSSPCTQAIYAASYERIHTNLSNIFFLLVSNVSMCVFFNPRQPHRYHC